MKEPNEAAIKIFEVCRQSSAEVVSVLERALGHFRNMSVLAYDRDFAAMDESRARGISELRKLGAHLDEQESAMITIRAVDPELYREASIESERRVLAQMTLPQVIERALIHSMTCGSEE